MQFPQETNNSKHVRSISTSNIEELVQFQINKNRRYTQLQAGRLTANYAEVNLGDVQIFRETLTAGARIEATPASVFLPFAAIAPKSGVFSYCGRETEDNTFIQATGGDWDICFGDRLDYVCTAFDREILNKNVELLTGQSIPIEWLVSKSSLINPYQHHCYAEGVAKMLRLVRERPEVLQHSSVKRMLSAEALKLTYDALLSATEYSTAKLQSRRTQGVRRVIDYLQAHAASLPTMAELCKIAYLSERSLEYGFKEYLGVTPIRYLRLVRLNGAKHELLTAGPKTDKVIDVALNWGFLEMGRFAGEYRQLFHELPSETLCKSIS
jgi:AraC family ethanolamine operon transcriptional activator